MGICMSCASIVTAERGQAGHDSLRKTSSKTINRTGRAVIAVTYYTCEVCGRKWRHDDDPGNKRAGWMPE